MDLKKAVSKICLLKEKEVSKSTMGAVALVNRG
jgi:hypothetical protein